MKHFAILKQQFQGRFWHCLYTVRRDGTRAASRQWQKECQENSARAYKRARQLMGIEE